MTNCTRSSHQAEGHQAEGHQAEGHQVEGHQVEKKGTIRDILNNSAAQVLHG